MPNSGLTNANGKSRALPKVSVGMKTRGENKLSDSESISFLCAMIILSVFGNLDKCIKPTSTEFIPQMSKKSCLQSLLAVRDGFGTML